MSNLGRLLRTEAAVPEEHVAREAETLRCGCIEGFLTAEEHHESWCPRVTGTYSSLPIVEVRAGG